MNISPMTKSLLLFLCLSIELPLANATPEEFWSTWSDGMAEVNAYQIDQNRYGEKRSGHIYLIYVTEPFSRKRKVKVSEYDAQNSDHTIALKLNIIERFQTGIYDYRLMTSHFVDATRQMRPIKSVFSSQEWCGVTYERLEWSDREATLIVDSYFDGESQRETFDQHLWSVDHLLITARGLQRGGPFEVTSLDGPWIGSAKDRRMKHLPTALYSAKPHFQSPTHLRTPLGQTEVRPLSYQKASGASCILSIELQSPHRIMGWRCNDGEIAKLLRSKRLPYWKLTRAADRGSLKGLGVKEDDLIQYVK
jgi:hypothetical protein